VLDNRTMPWEWVNPGIAVPEKVWKQFGSRLEALYGPKNKGKRKWLFTLAFQLLLNLKDDEIRALAHQIEAEELGLAQPRETSQQLDELLASRSTSPRRGKAS